MRFVNVVDMMRLLPDSIHPHGLPDAEFNALFTADRPVIFAWHGYPATIHRLTYRRDNHDNFHVRGYKEEGTTTTPFDMVMMNNLDRYHLVTDVIDRVPGLAAKAASTRQVMIDRRNEAKGWTRTHGDDHPRSRRMGLAARAEDFEQRAVRVHFIADRTQPAFIWALDAQHRPAERAGVASSLERLLELCGDELPCGV